MHRLRLPAFLLTTFVAVACGGGSSSESPAGESTHDSHSGGMPRTASEAAERDASTDLTTTPLSAADYRLYANIMGGASALSRSLSADDRALLEFAKRVDSGTLQPGLADREKLARARVLQNKDDELARLQGIEPRYREVKMRIEALIGKNAAPPSPDDPLSRENLRFLEAHRATIERLQADVRDPLSRVASEK